MTLEKKKVIFFNVDTQNDFMDSKGLLYIPDGEKIKHNLKILTEIAAEQHLVVVNTADYHKADDKEISWTPDFVKTFPPHCLAGTWGQEYIREVYPKIFGQKYYICNPSDTSIDEDKFKISRNIIIHKNAFDVFVGNKWTHQIIQLLAPDIVIIYGVTTQVCVRYAIEGFLYYKNKKLIDDVCLVTDAIAGLPVSDKEPDLINIMLNDWKRKGVNLITTDKIR